MILRCMSSDVEIISDLLFDTTRRYALHIQTDLLISLKIRFSDKNKHLPKHLLSFETGFNVIVIIIVIIKIKRSNVSRRF